MFIKIKRALFLKKDASSFANLRTNSFLVESNSLFTPQVKYFCLFFSEIENKT